MSNLLARVSLYAAGLTTGEAFSTLFVEGSSRAFLTMLGGALAGLLVGSTGWQLRFLLLPPVAAFYALLAVYGRVPLSWGDGEISSQKPEGTSTKLRKPCTSSRFPTRAPRASSSC